MEKSKKVNKQSPKKKINRKLSFWMSNKLCLLIIITLLFSLTSVFAAKDFEIKNNSNSFFYLNGSTGKIGIGTTSPTSTLSVTGTINASIDVCTTDGKCLSNTGTGSGTVNSGLANKLAYYSSTGTTVDDLTGSVWGAIYYDASGNVQSGTLPVLSGGTGATTLTNLITLGIHTTGNYVLNVSNGNGISVSGVDGEGSTKIVSISATTCSATEYSYWNGTSWMCRLDVNSGGTGNGTVTSVAILDGGGITVSGSPITSNGTIILTAADTSATNEIQTLGTSGNNITLTSGGSIIVPYATNADTLDGIDSTAFTRADLTFLGKTGNQALDSVTNTAVGWSNLPVGYSRMISNTIGTVGGAPVNNYGYFTKAGNRDTGGGWGGIWVGYSNGENYIGRASTSAGFATWDKLWSDNNDGSGSGLDADLLDGLSSAIFYNASNPAGYITAAQIPAVSDVWVNTSGDTMTGNLIMGGFSANIALGSNYLSGDGDDEGIFVSSTGNVAIGTTSVNTTLTVNGLIQLVPQTTATCNSAVEGALFYNKTSKHFFGCNGNVWIKLDTTYSD